jgi:hypothetical protein
MTISLARIRLIILILLCSIGASAQSSSRATVLKQLNELKSAILNADKTKVAAYFDFPVNSEELKLRTEFADEAEIDISTFDKKTFLQYYDRIITDDIVTFFKNVDFDDLKSKNKVERKMIPANKVETCNYIYTAAYAANGIQLKLATTTRRDIELKEEDRCPEYAETWQFKLKNGHLKFSGFTAAG